ncbi:LPD7 domain-containing protein, partial [Escherichia coli]
MAVAKGWNSITFEGNQLFLEQAYEEATKAGLVVK